MIADDGGRHTNPDSGSPAGSGDPQAIDTNRPMLRVTVEDLDTGEIGERDLPAGEYLLITTDPCYQSGVQAHGNGTHVVTIKGRIRRG